MLNNGSLLNCLGRSTRRLWCHYDDHGTSVQFPPPTGGTKKKKRGEKWNRQITINTQETNEKNPVTIVTVTFNVLGKLDLSCLPLIQPQGALVFLFFFPPSGSLGASMLCSLLLFLSCLNLDHLLSSISQCKHHVCISSLETHRSATCPSFRLHLSISLDCLTYQHLTLSFYFS